MTYDRFDSLKMLAVKERKIDGRHSDQTYRQHAEHSSSLMQKN
jgi:hypothetical protein